MIPNLDLAGRLSKNRLKLLLIAAIFALLAGLVRAQPTAHYCPGSEGLLGPSLPPPGLYARDYNVFYTADRFNDNSGRDHTPPNYSVFTYAQVPRVVWITDTKFLGADVGTSMLLPFVEERVKAGNYSGSSFGMGDLLVDGILSWHLQQFDFVFAPALWIPTGDSGPGTTRAGLGYWDGMLTAGATWYIDGDKTWAVSALNRYEINSEERYTSITPGNAYTLEWGVSKKFLKIFNAGATGYYQQKVTADRGGDGSPNWNRVAAAGPEFSAVIPKIEVNASLRYLYEFMSENRAQGQTITLTLTKRF